MQDALEGAMLSPNSYRGTPTGGARPSIISNPGSPVATTVREAPALVVTDTMGASMPVAQQTVLQPQLHPSRIVSPGRIADSGSARLSVPSYYLSEPAGAHAAGLTVPPTAGALSLQEKLDVVQGGDGYRFGSSLQPGAAMRMVQATPQPPLQTTAHPTIYATQMPTATYMIPTTPTEAIQAGLAHSSSHGRLPQVAQPVSPYQAPITPSQQGNHWLAAPTSARFVDSRLSTISSVQSPYGTTTFTSPTASSFARGPA